MTVGGAETASNHDGTRYTGRGVEQRHCKKKRKTFPARKGEKLLLKTRPRHDTAFFTAQRDVFFSCEIITTVPLGPATVFISPKYSDKTRPE